jgi:hypothetical protein
MGLKTKTHVGRTLIALAGAFAMGWSGVGLAAQPALADTLCVARATTRCFSTVQAAVDAAHDGDTIMIGPGTFAGGITIDKSVELVGAGARATIIKGGGPVITIGTMFAPTQPTVSISRVTVTGGLTTTKPPGFHLTIGGGIWIPPAAGDTTGATVSIGDSVITRNTVAPATADPPPTDPPNPRCGPLGCAFAAGGGIANSGTLTVTNTRISDNAVGPSIASEAGGGGIRNRPMGTLTLRRSFVTNNRVVAIAPNGVFAIAGGISAHGVITIEDSVVSDNSVSLDASLSGEAATEAAAFDGGIELSENPSAAITRTTVRGNSVEARNDSGPVLAGGGAIGTDEGVSLLLRDSAINHNSVSATSTAPGAIATAYAGGLEIQGVEEVTGSRFFANEVRASAPAGFPVAAGGGIFAWTFAPATVSDSVVADNSVASSTTSGEVFAGGGGVFNAGQLTLRRTVVAANDAAGAGPAGVAQGGGLWNGFVSLPGFPENVELTLIDARVTGNKLTGSAGIGLEGGGIFTAFPITMSGTVIAGNEPDQCSGC